MADPLRRHLLIGRQTDRASPYLPIAKVEHWASGKDEKRGGKKSTPVCITPPVFFIYVKERLAIIETSYVSEMIAYRMSLPPHFFFFFFLLLLRTDLSKLSVTMVSVIVKVK